MVKSVRRKTADAVTTAAARSSKSLRNRSGQVTDRDIARRAYELYEKRRREHGHDLDDWLQAERELQDAPSSTAASLLEGGHHAARTPAQSYPRRVS
jgi:outer membrane protein TolC